MTKIEKWIEEQFEPGNASYNSKSISRVQKQAARETAKYILEECGVREALEPLADGWIIESSDRVKAKEALNKIKGEKSD